MEVFDTFFHCSMKFLRCCLYGLFTLVLPATHALPTSYYGNEPLNHRRITENYVVDIHAFSSVFSTHLLFDHLDGTFSSLSKNMSLHFQDLVQVSAQSFGINDGFVVDVELLKGQLQGAVGCKLNTTTCFYLIYHSDANTFFFYFSVY